MGSKQNLDLPWRTLTFQLIAIIILPLTMLLLAITFGSITLHQNAMRSLVGERDKRAALASASALEEQINHRFKAIRSLSLQAAAEQAGELNTILDSADYLRSDFDIGLAYIKEDGSLLAATGDGEFWEALSSTSSSDMQAILAQNLASGFTFKTFPHPGNGEPLALIAAKVPKHDWMIAGAFSTQRLIRQTLVNAFPDRQVSVIVVNADNQLLYQNGASDLEQNGSVHPGVLEALRGESGTVYRQVDGSEHVIAYSPVEAAGWALVIEEPWEKVVTPRLFTTQMAPLVLVPVVLLASLALWLGVRQVVQPLQALESRAADLAWGNYRAIEEPVGGIAEIRHLQAELIHMAHKVRAAQQSLHGYIGAITAGQEEERRRLARELHDDTLQSLIALKQRAQLAHMTLGNGSTAAKIEELEALAENTIENLRRLTSALRPIYLEDLGLVAALEMLANETGKAFRFPVKFQRRGAERRLKPAVELALYRMVQEALSNIARHAEASLASVTITFTAQEVTLEVYDNGKGFNVPKSPAEFAPNGHFGLLGLYERAELIGASLKIHSSPGQGTRLRIDL